VLKVSGKEMFLILQRQAIIGKAAVLESVNVMVWPAQTFNILMGLICPLLVVLL
jgi:hypothetical protein